MTRDGEFVMPSPGVPTTPLERLDVDSPEAQRYVVEGRPFVTRIKWPALEWTPETLKTKVGDEIVQTRDREGNFVPVTVSQYLDIVQDQRRSSGKYLPHNGPIIKAWGYDGPVAGMETLMADIELPRFIRRDQIASMFVWVRNFGAYDNKGHCEPNAASNFNVQLRGKKHVWLFPPHDAGKLGAAASKAELVERPHFSVEQRVYHPSDEHPEFKDVRCYEIVLEPGDAVYIPPFWFHWFVHYNVYQMNFNVWFMNDSLQLSPVSAEWAYMNALAEVLGGFENFKERFTALPAQTQDLLVKIANTLVNDPTRLDARKIIMAKAEGAPIAVNPRLLEVAADVEGKQ